MSLSSKVLGVLGAVAIALSLWSGNQPGLFGVGLVLVIVALVFWGISRGRNRSVG